MDFGNSLNEYKSHPSGAEADYVAIAKDWAMIGLDFRNAVAEFEVAEAEHGPDRGIEEEGVSGGE